MAGFPANAPLQGSVASHMCGDRLGVLLFVAKPTVHSLWHILGANNAVLQVPCALLRFSVLLQLRSRQNDARRDDQVLDPSCVL